MTVKVTRIRFVWSSIAPVPKSLPKSREKHRLRKQQNVQTTATAWLSVAAAAGVLVVRLVMKKLARSKESWLLERFSQSRVCPH